MAEGEMCADTNGLNSAQIYVQSLNKHFGRDLAHRFIEGQNEGSLNAKSLDCGKALGEMLNEARRRVGRDHHGGVLGKRDAHGRGFKLMGIGNGLSQDLLMPEMHAIEETNGAADAAGPTISGLQFAGVFEDFHSEMPG